MEIKVEASPGICNQFIDRPHGTKAEVSVVIAPLKVEANEEGTRLNIAMGCNLWRSCQNEDCYYSLASRKVKK
uniref:Uncharacterized protein n=1 Tax=viral metagenome TaxID=1070528 RepID=A0A6M3M6L4_9ZZZZ